MYEKIKEYASKKYDGDETMVTSFMEGFIKEASQSDMFGFSVGERAKSAASSDSLLNGIGSAIGKGLGGLGVGLALHGVNMAVNHAGLGSLHTEFLSALEKAISANPILRQQDRKKVQDYAETIFKFAPHVAGDANLLSSILANAIHGEGIDPMTIKTLGDLESRYVENKSSGGFSPKAYV